MPKTTAVVFPFDCFGNAGTAAGATHLGDFLAELLDDNAAEDRPMRPNAYAESLFLQEAEFPDLEALANWRATGRRLAADAFRHGDRLIWLGGNHLSVLPVYEELGAARGGLVLQFDAHLDVYQLHDINPNPANGNFLLHADGPLPAVVNLGHRDLFLPPAEVRKHFAAAYSALNVESNLDRVIADVRRRVAKAKKVWIDLDADAFDPAALPAVHYPLPGGLTLLTVLRILSAVWHPDKIAGVSVSEFDPSLDRDGTAANLLGWLLEWLLLKWYEG